MINMQEEDMNVVTMVNGIKVYVNLIIVLMDIILILIINNVKKIFVIILIIKEN
jgi:hypothetical protein